LPKVNRAFHQKQPKGVENLDPKGIWRNCGTGGLGPGVGGGNYEDRETSKKGFAHHPAEKKCLGDG